MTRSFRVYTNPDIVGCEIAGALKNVIAIAVGTAAGLGYGDNAQAALVTRGLAELTRLGVALGGQPLTFAGLAGLGDLVATCTSAQSRNRTVGFRAGAGPWPRRDRGRDEHGGRGGAEHGGRARAGGSQPAWRCRSPTIVGAVLYDGRQPADLVPRAHAAGGEAGAARSAVTSRDRARAGGSRHLVGVLGGERVAAVDGIGTVRPERAGWELGWWVGADDRWHLPEEEVAVRQSLARRHAGGVDLDAGARRRRGAARVRRRSDVGVVDIANESPAPFVAASSCAVRPSVDTDGATVLRRRPAGDSCSAPPARWAMTTDGTTAQIVTGGGARDDAFSLAPTAARASLPRFSTRSRTRRDCGSCLPLRLRTSRSTAATVPDAEQVVRGWRAQLDRGMRVELPDPCAASRGRHARAQLLLAGQAWMAVPEVVVALEDWGFDDEARAAWNRLGIFARRKAARRPTAPVLGRRAACSAAGDRLSSSTRSAARSSTRGRPTSTCSELAARVAWASARRARRADELGPVSYSVRWHGDRVALLWDVPAGAERPYPRPRRRVVDRRASRRDAARTRRVTRYASTRMEPYRAAAPAYDLFYRDKDYHGEVDEIARLVEAPARARARCSTSGAVPAHTCRGSRNGTSEPKGSNPARG